MPGRAAWLAEATQRPSAWVLVVVNLALVYGVLAWDWDVFSIVFLYWCENLVIGVLNVARMLVANPSPQTRIEPGDLGSMGTSRADRLNALSHLGLGMVMKLFLVPFFILHYGGFCLGHGFFVFALFGENVPTNMNMFDQAYELLTGPLGLSLLLLALSHTFSFLFNFMGAGEYRRTNAAALMMRPYGRIVVLHITIIVGGFLAMAFDNAMGLLLVLVVLKTGVDLGMHIKERQHWAAT